MADLFQNTPAKASNYSAKDIEVLEGLEPVRRRPGMYIGGTDERALHHLVAELLDNAMDEAVAGHATRIEVELSADGSTTVRDNGRGIPVDPHKKFKGKSALEVILTTLHSGAKFSQKAYQTSGGLHGVGVSVVNALSERLLVEVARERQLWRQEYQRGKPKTKLKTVGQAPNRRGTSVTFWPDSGIFGEGARLHPPTLYRMARSKAYLFKGVEIRWRCDPALLREKDQVPESEDLRFPNGLRDFLDAALQDGRTLTPDPFVGETKLPDEAGRVEWAISWPASEEGFVHSYCNTVPTSQGGSHESGLRSGMLRSLKTYGDLVGNRRASKITAEDVLGGAAALLSIFIKNPQ
ncbi:MAG: ATP-binding protein, partial [Kiloniellales bacterium]|nr:ATP-binding protein [Kiloniellales bacterium]